MLSKGLLLAAPAFAKARSISETLANGELDIATPLVESVALVMNATQIGGNPTKALEATIAHADIFNTPSESAQMLSRLIAVSYTHLDVYKRQGDGNTRTRSSRPPQDHG